MAEAGTKKQRSEEENLNTTPPEKTEGLARRSSEGIARHRAGLFPSIFSVSPGEFFTMSPITLMRRFTEDIDRAFSDVGGLGREARAGESYATWVPAIEVRQSGNNFIVHADLPGLSESEVNVEATEDGLLIEGERKREQTSEQGGWHRSERVYGRFSRLIPLPEGASIDNAKASFSNGVLQVTVPVPESATRRRQIPIGPQEAQTSAASSTGQTQAKAAGR